MPVDDLRSTAPTEAAAGWPFARTRVSDPTPVDADAAGVQRPASATRTVSTHTSAPGRRWRVVAVGFTTWSLAAAGDSRSDSPGSGDELEAVAVGWADDGEVPSVDRRDPALVESFGDRDDAGVGAAERQRGVGGDELVDSFPVLVGEVLDDEVAIDDRLVEGGFGGWTEFTFDQVGALGDHHRSGDHRAGLGGEHRGAALVVAVGAVSCGDEHSGVYDQHAQSRPKPSANSSSI